MAKTVVAVDDEIQVRDLVSTILEENGYTALLAQNGEEAMNIVRQNRGLFSVPRRPGKTQAARKVFPLQRNISKNRQSRNTWRVS